MDGIIALFTEIILESGISQNCIFHKQHLQLPGYFRPRKEWDLLVIQNGHLIIAIDVKTQCDPISEDSFYRLTGEVLGGATDFWAAYREGSYNCMLQPWLGYLFILENCNNSKQSVKMQEPHFPVFLEFVSASYIKRYEIFWRKLARERLCSASSFILSSSAGVLNGEYTELASDLNFEMFIRSMVGQITAYQGLK